ncbi:MAG: HupE/UreJ family protein [Xanthobacteraceae bacterium]
MMHIVMLTVLLGVAATPALAHHVMGGATPVTFSDGLLSGLGHPLIELDHLAAIIAIGCIAARERRGSMLVVCYVIAMMLGAAGHVGEATVAGAEVFVAISVLVLGAVLLAMRPIRVDVAIALFACAGLLHGYALGESIAGAQPAPISAYLMGLTFIQSAVALAIMALARVLAARSAVEPSVVRGVAAAVLLVGVVALVRQLAGAT